MSIIMQYLVLRAVLLKTHQVISSPSAFAVSYDSLHALPLVWRIPFLSQWANRAQWKTCCVLFNMGLVQMKQVTKWKIAVSKEGAMYLAELKMQIIKSICSVLLAAVSAVLFVHLFFSFIPSSTPSKYSRYAVAFIVSAKISSSSFPGIVTCFFGTSPYSHEFLQDFSKRPSLRNYIQRNAMIFIHVIILSLSYPASFSPQIFTF